jgi:hypothetical protein
VRHREKESFMLKDGKRERERVRNRESRREEFESERVIEK